MSYRIWKKKWLRLFNKILKKGVGRREKGKTDLRFEKFDELSCSPLFEKTSQIVNPSSPFPFFKDT